MFIKKFIKKAEKGKYVFDHGPISADPIFLKLASLVILRLLGKIRC